MDFARVAARGEWWLSDSGKLRDDNLPGYCMPIGNADPTGWFLSCGRVVFRSYAFLIDDNGTLRLIARVVGGVPEAEHVRLMAALCSLEPSDDQINQQHSEASRYIMPGTSDEVRARVPRQLAKQRRLPLAVVGTGIIDDSLEQSTAYLYAHAITPLPLVTRQIRELVPTLTYLA